MKGLCFRGGSREVQNSGDQGSRRRHDSSSKSGLFNVAFRWVKMYEASEKVVVANTTIDEINNNKN